MPGATPKKLFDQSSLAVEIYLSRLIYSLKIRVSAAVKFMMESKLPTEFNLHEYLPGLNT